MDIKIVFNAQLRDRLGCKDQSLSLDDTAKLADLWPLLREGDAAGIFDAEGKMVRSVMAFRNGSQVPPGENPDLADGDTVTLLTPISGG